MFFNYTNHTSSHTNHTNSHTNHSNSHTNYSSSHINHSNSHIKKNSVKSRHNSQYHCNCEQLFYIPLPTIPVKNSSQTITPSEWFAPGSVQSCCNICSSIKPIYTVPCNSYCCNK